MMATYQWGHSVYDGYISMGSLGVYDCYILMGSLGVYYDRYG